MERRNLRSPVEPPRRVVTLIWAALIPSLVVASAVKWRDVYAQDHIGSVNDYLNASPDFPEADEFPLLGIAVINGGGSLQGGHQFEGAEIVGVVPGSPGALAGLKGRQQRMQTLITAGILAASAFFPPAILAVGMLGSSGIGESHEFIIAVDGTRVHDSIEFGKAIDQAEPGEIVYLTIVRNGQREQIQVALAGRRSNSPFFVSEPNG